MEVSYSELKNKEVINVSDGKRLGHIIDILFDNVSGVVKGIVVPGDKKIFRKSEDLFVPLTRVKKIGDDVVLVFLKNLKNINYATQTSYNQSNNMQCRYENRFNYYEEENRVPKSSFVRYKRINEKKYK